MHKMVLLGDSNTGKTTLFQAIMHPDSDSERNAPRPTLQPDFTTTTVTSDATGRTETFRVWDTVGTERYASIPTNVYRNAHVVCLLYDVTSIQSLVSLKDWKCRAEEHHGRTSEVVYVVVGNKVDLLPGYSVDDEPISLATVAAEEFAEKNQCWHFLISAATRHGVHELMSAISEKAAEIHSDQGLAPHERILHLTPRTASTRDAPPVRSCQCV